MLTRWSTGWNDFDDMFSALRDLRTRMDRAFDDTFGGDLETRRGPVAPATWPRANLTDAGSKLVMTAEVPGLSQQDVTLSLNQEVLTIQGERKVEVPEGYSVHRRERPEVRFTRSFALPCRVDADRANASIKNGILTVTIEKSPDAMPRQISVANGS
jgi:HSP20 family protein